MIGVSQVLEFRTEHLNLLKQLPITKIIHISSLKLFLNRSRLFDGGRLMEGALILPHQDFEKRDPEGFLKYSSFRCGNYRNLNYFLTKSSFGY